MSKSSNDRIDANYLIKYLNDNFATIDMKQEELRKKRKEELRKTTGFADEKCDEREYKLNFYFLIILMKAVCC